jgi:catechol 2,3-dioxygenase-like lactoylglutathione lyase family enzyme
MATEVTVTSNVKQAVPFLNVTNIEASLRFYVDGLGCMVTNQWVPEGRVRWCWLQLGDAALMLQEYWRNGHPAGLPRASGARRLHLLHVRRRDRDLPRAHLSWRGRATPVCGKSTVGHVSVGPGWLPSGF